MIEIRVKEAEEKKIVGEQLIQDYSALIEHYSDQPKASEYLAKMKEAIKANYRTE